MPASTARWVANAPRRTAAAGWLYDNRRGPCASLVGKHIGPQYGGDSDVDADGQTAFANQYPIHSFFNADLSAGYRLLKPGRDVRELDFGLNIYNLFDNHSISGFAGTQSVSGDPLCWTVPGMTVFFNVSARLF